MPIPVTAPPEVLKAYGASTLAATCLEGRAYEFGELGVCADDFTPKTQEPSRPAHAGVGTIANATAKLPVAVSLEIPEELIVNALDSANIVYWARVPKGADHHDLLAGRDTATIMELGGAHDGEGDGCRELTGDKVRRGLGIMAAKYPQHFAYLMSDNADAETGDTLVQCALFGEIVYG